MRHNTSDIYFQHKNSVLYKRHCNARPRNLLHCLIIYTISLLRFDNQ